MRRQLWSALRVTIVLTVLLGIAYPLVVTGISQLVFAGPANGSLAHNARGAVVGSVLIGQNFADKAGKPLPQYFQPRPSGAGTNGYDAANSGASNLGPSNPTLLQAVADRASAYRQLNGLPTGAAVPVDAVTASGSGLDPDISVANALDQAARVAGARKADMAAITSVVHHHVRARPWGVLGEDTVNVLDLNLALDRAYPAG
jgi:K+-transporting ATPase ATPase C chain